MLQEVCFRFDLVLDSLAAHRFAITHHRKLRAKAATKAGLRDKDALAVFDYFAEF
ncbi:MAG: hypothetical protein RRB13_06680 [bacterium]|nr:hypothetical protein [bacterium]